jgi:hypothetical protein
LIVRTISFEATLFFFSRFSVRTSATVAIPIIMSIIVVLGNSGTTRDDPGVLEVPGLLEEPGALEGGWGNFDAKTYFCGHFKIDIADLSKVALNM